MLPKAVVSDFSMEYVMSDIDHCRAIRPDALAIHLLAEVAANPKDRPLSVVFYENEKKPAPKYQLQLKFADLCCLLARRLTRDDKSGIGFSMVALRPGTSRSNANVVSRSGIECDIDHGATFDEIKPRIAGIAYCAYSTHNHNPDDGRIKYRIVIPFSRDVGQAEWPAIWRGVTDVCTK